MNSKRGFAAILPIIVIGILIVVIASFLIYSPQKGLIKTTAYPTVAVDETSSWETYNTTLFSFKYPKEMTVNAGTYINNIAYRGPTNEKTKELLLESNKYSESTPTDLTKIAIDSKPAYIRRIITDSGQAKNETLNQTQVVIENIPFHKNNKLMNNGILFISIGIGGDQQKAEEISNLIISTIKFNDLDNQKLLSLRLNDLEFQLQNTWWYEYRNYKNYNFEDYFLYTRSNARPYDFEDYNLDDFEIRYSPNKQESLYGSELFNNEYFVWEKEQEIIVDGIKSKRIERKRNSKTWNNSQYIPYEVSITVVIPYGNGQYLFWGTISSPELRQNFDQILSTFKFTN